MFKILQKPVHALPCLFFSIALVSDGSSEHEAHTWWMETDNWICFRHLFTSTAVEMFFKERLDSLHTFPELPSNFSTMTFSIADIYIFCAGLSLTL